MQNDNNYLTPVNSNLRFDNGLNEIKVVEILPSDFNTDIDDLKYFFDTVQINYLDNKTTTKTYYKGDNRSQPDTKFKDYNTVYEYLLLNLKDEKLKDQFKKVYNPVFDKIYGEENDNVEDKMIRDLNLIKINYKQYKDCKGYILKIIKGNDSYGFIYLKNESKPKKLVRQKKIENIIFYPFINSTKYKIIGKGKEIISINKFIILFDAKNFETILKETRNLLNDNYKIAFDNNLDGKQIKVFSLI